MKIGIRFSDNDYATYIQAFLSMLPKLNYGTYDKVNLVKTFNLVAPELSKLTYISRHGELHPKDTTDNYFQITVDDVYFDNEITEYLNTYCKHDSTLKPGTTYYGDNYEFHWVDLESGFVTSV